MIIHFIAAKHTLDRDYKHLREIRNTIVKLGHHLTRDWLDKEHDMIRSPENTNRINWWISTKKDLRTLTRADFDSFATIKQYDIGNLYATIETFIDENKVEKKDMRFNFFINPEINAYLKRQAHITGKNKSEVLRDLVLKEINK